MEFKEYRDYNGFMIEKGEVILRNIIITFIDIIVILILGILSPKALLEDNAV